MPEDRLALYELLDQRADDDLVRHMLDFAADRLSEAEPFWKDFLRSLTDSGLRALLRQAVEDRTMTCSSKRQRPCLDLGKRHLQ